MGLADYIGLGKHRHTPAYHTDKILRHYDTISDYIAKNDNDELNLKGKLESLVQEKYNSHKGLMRGANLIDWMNRWVVAPADLVGRALGPATGGVGYVVSNVAKIASWIPKALYGAYYTLKTGDFSLLGTAGAQEFASYALPFGGAAYLANAYGPSASRYLRREAAKEFESRYMKETAELFNLDAERAKRQKPAPGRQPGRRAA